ncbi:MAG: response regulator [Alphaproteobacteria bacterium]|nr:response regulator [Alphaproteobacteria bacterium]MBP7757704.1 response regulator [Alphaproteobacteria bacterium]MBP7761096.1 response regulator [Alphaproteobacteria bacterium]MBP7904706.1 response regulator [Alphaproteobacteria bacterium]
MDILSLNAEVKLAATASSIGRNPLSWQGWHCLRILIEDVSEDNQQEILIWSKSILESYLRDAEGRVYYCEGRDIHVICRDVPRAILEQAGNQICDLIFNESRILVSYDIYELSSEGTEYSKAVLEQKDIFTLPYSQAVSVGTDMEQASFPGEAPRRSLTHSGAPRVLLVEDDAVTRWMVRNALKNECEFITAPSANKAFAMFSSFTPDVIFLDINLPDNSGYAVLEWILNNDPGACVVMFSSNGQLDNIVHAMEKGASGFISKPFLREHLLYYIQSHSQSRV